MTEQAVPGIDDGLLAHITNFCTDKLLEYQSAPDWAQRDKQISWQIPKIGKIATMSLKPSAASPGEYRIMISVGRTVNDEIGSYFLEKGSREALLDYLRKPETREEIIRSVKELCAP